VATKSVNPGKAPGVISGISLSRTLPPVLPPNFLSRKAILSRVAVDRGGVTLIVAPAGYGKTSLVAEFVSSLDFPTIWLSFNDSDNQLTFNSHLVQAVRNVFPNAANWYEPAQEMSTPDVLGKILVELGAVSEHIVMVLDSNRVKNAEAAPLADHFLDLIPANIHAIAIRRHTPVLAIARLQSLPNFKLLDKNDLAFSKEEVSIAASLQGIEVDQAKVSSILETAHGWPSAVQLILNSISRGSQLVLDPRSILGGSEQIKYLVEELLETMSDNDRKFIDYLSVCDEFSLEVAEVILQDRFSLNQLNNLANEALFIRHTSDPVDNYAFNSVVKAGLLRSISINENELKKINHRLSVYFESRGQNLRALEHARSSGDMELYINIFREAMRELLASGRGKDLLRMAELIGDSSTIGTLKRQTVELIGYTADFQYLNAQSLISEMLTSSRGSEMEDFIKKFTAAASTYIDFATGLYESLDSNVDLVLDTSSAELDLAAIDRISIIKVAVAKEIIFDNSDRIVKLQEIAIELAVPDNTVSTAYALNAIDACVLLYKGEFKAALVAANTALAQAEREGYAGIFGPLDVMFVKARCLLEFSQTDAAQLLFEQIRNLATTWEQYTWVFVAESFIARDLALTGRSAEALSIVRAERERTQSMAFNNGMVVHCDLTELFIKFSLGDWARVGILLGRLPNFLLVERIRAIYDETIGKVPSSYDVKSLPSRYPKEEMYKLLAEVEESIDQEAISLGHMRAALEIGARVGAKETFLRQDARVLNLIIRIAGEKPTVYLEDLASLITSRLKSRGKNLVGLSAALTKRELEILRHLATGVPISAIATNLHVSQNTMKTHLKNVYRKIDASGRDEAVAKAKSLYIL
jgi:ATP/maltotriose-dependent transcriptional regulator MalT